jgi:GAF domain-containing protein
VTGITITAAWYTAEEDGERLSLAASSGPYACHVLSSVRIREGVTGWVAAHRRRIVNADPKLDFGSLAAAARLTSCLSVPLVSSQGVFGGVLTLYAVEPQAFGEADARTIESAATHLLSAVAACADPRPVSARDLKLVSSR